MAKSDEFKVGDHVAWGDADDHTSGKIVRKLTEPYTIKSFTAHASKDDPFYLIETDRTGAEAAHKPQTLRTVGKGT
jgi:hypothetical protein